MATRQLDGLVRHIRHIALGNDGGGMTDGELVKCFVSQGDEAAFAALVRRYGPLVLGVCRRVLRHRQDAEDAFQATFLVLLHKAGSIVRPELVGHWLYGVAYFTAKNAKASTARRRNRERQASEMARAQQFSEEDGLSELRHVLDEELSRLPEKYRVPVVLCELQGKNRKEVARHLGCPEGTVSSRLARARQMLRKRLAKRGLALSAGSFAVALSRDAASASVPAPLVASTIKTVMLVAASPAPTAGVVSAQVAALTEGVLKTMFLAKLKTATALLLAFGILTGAAMLTRHVMAAKERQGSAVPQPQSPEQPTAQANPGKPQPAAKQPERPRADNRARTDRFGDALPEGALLRIGTIRYRAGASINKAALSPDGKLLATAYEGGVMLIDLDTGKPRPLRGTDVPNGFGNNTSILCFPPDGKELVNVTAAGSLRLWDVATGKLLRHREPDTQDTRFSQVWFPAGGKRLVVAMANNLPAAVKAGKGQVVFNHAVQILDSSSFKVIKEFPLVGELASVAGDGKTLAAIDSDHSQVVLYDDQGKELRRVSQAPSASIAALAADGKLLITVNQNSEIRLWDAVTGKEQRMIKGPVSGTNEQWLTVATSPDAKMLLAGTWSGDIQRWDLTTGKELEPLRAHRHLVTGLFLPPGGRTLVSVAWDGVVHRWDLASGKLEDSPEGYVGYLQVARSPDGRTIIAGDHSGRLETWDSATGQRLRILQKSGSFSTQQAFSPDGKWLAVAQADRSIRLLDAHDAREVRKLGAARQVQGRGAWFYELVFSPDGRFLVASEDADGTRMWEVATGKEVWHVAQQGRAAFSPDGRTLVTGGFDQILTFRDAATGKERRALDKEEIIDGLAFSPDGSILATSHHSGHIYLRDPNTGFKLKTLEGHNDVAWMTSFSPSGKWLASSGDHTVRIWEVATGKELLCLKGHEGRAYQALFGADSRTVLSSSLDLTALLWSIHPKPASNQPISLDTLWADLGGEPAQAYRATWAMADDPKASSAFLRQKISPVKLTVDEKRVKKLLEDLDSKRFQDRQSATLALKELGLAAEAALREALKTTKSAEVRTRITQILDDLKHEPTSEDVRRSRAVQALELAGTAEAEAVLAEWAAGSVYAPLTEDAGATLKRLDKQREFRGMP
jgi:RNA polymerase sigma factor (sigma-70 family)